MNSNEATSYVFAQAICALAEIEAMKAANFEREQQGYALAYGEDAFYNVIEKYCIHHNGVLGLFQT